MLFCSIVIQLLAGVQIYSNLPSTSNYYLYTEIRDILSGSFLPAKLDSGEKQLYLNDLVIRTNLRKSRRNIYADERRKILELNAAKKVFADKKSLNKKFAESQKSPMTSSLIPTIIGENDLQEISEEISSIRNIVGNLQNQIDLLISSQDNGQSIKDLLQKQHLEQQRKIFIKISKNHCNRIFMYIILKFIYYIENIFI